MKTLDLGCGATPRNPFDATEVYGVDIRDLGVNILKANLFLEKIPFESNTFDFVSAYHFIEHVPRTLCIFNEEKRENTIIFPFINLMNEIYRVLKMGGVFLSVTPAYPHAESFQDPTHVNFITENTFPLYFNDHYPVGHIYGFNGGFSVLGQQWDGSCLVTQLKKSEKPDTEKFQKY
jgi:SAM-dependent methyltransferase